MLGHDALGRWALGQLPSEETGAAVAPGTILPLTLRLVAGAASGEGVLPPIFIGGTPTRQALAPGAEFDLWVRLRPGRALGLDAHVDVAAGGAVLRRRAGIVAAGAEGDGQAEYDNALILALAA